MEFNDQLFLEYQHLVSTTSIQAGYQQILQLIKYIETNLENDMPGYTFMGRIVENQMNFSYFQLTNPKLKTQGLKIQVIFKHRTCQFEVWLSGYNRKIQQKLYPLLPPITTPFILCDSPQSEDYLLRVPIETTVIAQHLASIIAQIKTYIEQLEGMF